MDLCAESLHSQTLLLSKHVLPELIRPRWRRLAASLPLLGRFKLARNADRAWNRYRNYVGKARQLCGEFDWYHICDHSYAHLVHELPAERTGVYCHDIDAFRTILERTATRQSSWMRRLAHKLATGLGQAAVVFVNSCATKQELLEHCLVPAERIVFAPLGVSAEFTPHTQPTEAQALPSAFEGQKYLLHVGSCIPRKRIDVLLSVFAAIRSREPALRLLQVGGTWTAEQQLQIARLGLESHIAQIRGVPTSNLAGYYRQAALVLQPSSYEGFGLPVAEALACGATVVASDIPALREVGGEAALYCPVGDLEAWNATVSDLLSGRREAPSAAVRAQQAAKFSWAEHARIILDAYRKLPVRPGTRS